MPSRERLYYLFSKYIDETATVDELNELKAFLNHPSYEEATRDHLVDLLRQTTPLSGHSETRLQSILKEIRVVQTPSLSDNPSLSSRRLPLVRRWWAIAALFAGVAGATWLLTRPAPPQPGTVNRPMPKHDRTPGGNVAVLTLSDGSTITLDSAQNGALTRQGNTAVTKLSDGRLAYKTLDEKPVAPLSNTLSTPRGGQYRLTLPDGSEVWLNAASSITYPTAFSGTERTVSITGEAYFEVAKNADMPFNVIIHAPAGQEKIEVLGTHFNVKAYDDETMVATTLLEGSVRLSSKGAATLLSPGQQGQLRPDGIIHLDPHADTEEAIAWKNGLFHFEKADIRDVMRQIARWYDVEVVFSGKIPEEKFDGEIPRNNNLAEVLKILQLSNIHFSIEDRKVTVMP